jgi:ATP-dependent Clp protease adaptor protein ClpS
MALVAILAAFGLLVFVTVLAVVVVVWLAFPVRGDDWSGEKEAWCDESTAQPEVNNAVTAAREESERDFSAAAPGPQYQLVLLNDEVHSFNYVVRVFQQVFGLPLTRSVALTCEIHSQGRAVVFRGSLDEVNHKRSKVMEFGPDQWAPTKTAEPLGVLIERAS